MKYSRLKSFAMMGPNIRWDNAPSGCMGSYFKLPHNVGVKIYTDATFTSAKKARGSWTWWIAANALHHMKKAKRSGIVPSAYCISPIKVGKVYYVGLFMEHVEGYHPKSLSWNRMGRIANKLKRAGVAHYDLGEHNVMIGRKGRIQVLDFDSAGPWSKDNE